MSLAGGQMPPTSREPPLAFTYDPFGPDDRGQMGASIPPPSNIGAAIPPPPNIGAAIPPPFDSGPANLAPQNVIDLSSPVTIPATAPALANVSMGSTAPNVGGG